MAWSAPYYYEEYLDRLQDPKEPEFEKVKPLNTNGTAYVVRDRANGFICLQSYSTIVSFVVDGQVIDLGSWSVTTSKHQGQFRRAV